MRYILSFFLYLLLLLWNTGTEQGQSSEYGNEQITTEEIVHEQITEEISEQIEEQRELTYATIADVESTIIARIDELRSYIDGRFEEYARGTTGIDQSIDTNGTETETIIQEEDTKPSERHFWFRRIFE